MTILGNGDPDTDCEPVTTEVKDMLNNRIDVYSVWISDYFSLSEYQKTRELAYGYFSEFSTPLNIDSDNDHKEFLKYRLVETETSFYASFISQSYDFISRLTGEVARFYTVKPN